MLIQKGYYVVKKQIINVVILNLSGMQIFFYLRRDFLLKIIFILKFKHKIANLDAFQLKSKLGITENYLNWTWFLNYISKNSNRIIIGHVFKIYIIYLRTKDKN